MNLRYSHVFLHLEVMPFFVLQELCNHAEVVKDLSCRRQCMLTFGALVHKTYERPSCQQDTKLKTACEQHIKVT